MSDRLLSGAYPARTRHRRRSRWAALTLATALALAGCSTQGGGADPAAQEAPSPTASADNAHPGSPGDDAASQGTNPDQHPTDSESSPSPGKDIKDKLDKLRRDKPSDKESPDADNPSAKALRAEAVRNLLAQVNCLENADGIAGAPPSGDTFNRWPHYDGTRLLGAGYCVFQGDSAAWQMRQFTGDLGELETILAAPDTPSTSQVCTQQYEAQPSLWVVDEKGKVYIPRWPRDECNHLHEPKPWMYFHSGVTQVIASSESGPAEVPTTDR